MNVIAVEIKTPGHHFGWTGSSINRATCRESICNSIIGYPNLTMEVSMGLNNPQDIEITETIQEICNDLGISIEIKTSRSKGLINYGVKPAYIYLTFVTKERKYGHAISCILKLIRIQDKFYPKELSPWENIYIGLKLWRQDSNLISGWNGFDSFSRYFLNMEMNKSRDTLLSFLSTYSELLKESDTTLVLESKVLNQLLTVDELLKLFVHTIRTKNEGRLNNYANLKNIVYQDNSFKFSEE